MRKNKRTEITLSPEDYELLLSLTLRYNCSKSDIVKQALYCLSSKKKHDVHLMFREAFNQGFISYTEQEELHQIKEKKK